MAEYGRVKLAVYDLLGRQIGTLVNDDLRPGTYEAYCDGSGQASGVYFCRLAAGTKVQTTKMILAR